MITDKLGSYAAAHHQIMPAVEHRSHKGLNNRAWRGRIPSEDLREIDTSLPTIMLPTGGMNAMQMEQVNRSV